MFHHSFLCHLLLLVCSFTLTFFLPPYCCVVSCFVYLTFSLITRLVSYLENITCSVLFLFGSVQLDSQVSVELNLVKLVMMVVVVLWYQINMGEHLWIRE